MRISLKLAQQHYILLSSPALLPLSSILSALAKPRRAILNATCQRLEPVADLLRSGRVVDRIANATAGGAYNTADCLGETSDCIADL